MFQFPAFASQDLCIQSRDTCLTAGGLPHSEISGSKVVCYLPEAYRKLQRPSSPLAAKASTVYASSLDHITQNSLQTTKTTRITRSDDTSIRRKTQVSVFQSLTFNLKQSTSLSILLNSSTRLVIMVFGVKPKANKLRPSSQATRLLLGFHLLCLPRHLVEPSGIEPLTSCVQGRRSPS